MREKCLFEYAVIRIVPRVEREEFVNVGVIVYCPAQSFLAVEFEINEQKLRTFAPDLEISEIEKHLRAFEQISRGGDAAGVIGKLQAGARFRWLVAPRSTIVQTSPVHTGFCVDAETALNRLLDLMVR
ncbi:MAG TPA: DUF3037 domain-containing protein [Pyrinomonadaceae bacterium]|nr:DUF3037 domain-containing protein [Pyrinomonadaceae bacterium]